MKKNKTGGGIENITIMMVETLVMCRASLYQCSRHHYGILRGSTLHLKSKRLGIPLHWIYVVIYLEGFETSILVHELLHLQQ